MLIKTITYKDFADNEREGTMYFNLTRAELTRWMIEDEGLIHRLQTIQSKSGKEIMAEFDNIIKRAFGVRTDDGKRFIKSDEVYQDFLTTALYSEFFMQLVTDPDAAQDFLNGLMPQDLVAEAQAEMEKTSGSAEKAPSEGTETGSSVGASGI